MSVLQIAMQHESFREPPVPRRPSELYTFAPYRCNPTHLIHFAQLGDLPILRRYHPRSFASSIPGWPWRKKTEPFPPWSSDEMRSPGGSPPANAPQVPPTPPPPTPDPCATETVVKALRALKPDRKRPTEEEGYPSSPAQENKPRSQDSVQSRQLTSQPKAASGDPPAPSVPKHGSEESTTAASSSSTITPAKRVARNNNILSSYSSSGGIERLWIEAGLDLSQIKRFMPPTEELMGWSWKTLMEEKKAKATKKKTSTPAKKVDKQVQAYIPPQPVELPLPRWIIPPSPPLLVDGRPWRGSRLREVRLFHQSKEPLIMPPFPDPGYKVTRADYDADREERWRQFKRGLDSSKDSPPPVDEAPTPARDPSAAARGGPDGQSHEQLRQNSGQAGDPCATLGAPPVPGPLPPPPPFAPSPPTLPTGATGGLASPPNAEATPQPFPSGSPTAVAASSPSSNPAQPEGAESSLAMALRSTPKSSILFGMLTSPPVETSATVPTPAAATGPILFPLVFGSPAQSLNPWGSSRGTLTLTTTASTGGPSYTFQPVFGASQPTTTTGPANAVASSATFAAHPSLPPVGGGLVLPSGGFPGFSGPLQSPSSGAATMTTISTPSPMFSLGEGSGMASGVPPGGAVGPSLLGAAISPSPPTPFGASFSQAPANGAAPPMATGISATADPSFATPLAMTTPSLFNPVRPRAFRAKRGASDNEPPPPKVAALGLERRATPLNIPGLGANQATGGGVGGGGSSSSGGSSPAQNPFGGAAVGAKRTPQPSSAGSKNSSSPSQTPFSGATFGANSAPQPANGGGGSSISSVQNPFGGAAFGVKRAPQASSGSGKSSSPSAQNPFGGSAFGGQSLALPFGTAAPGTPTTSAFGMGAQSPSVTSSGCSGDFVFGGPAAPSAALFPFGTSTQPSPQVSPGGGSAFGRRGGNGGSSGGNGNGSSSATVGVNQTSHPPFGSSGGLAGPSSIEDKLICAFRNGPPLPKTWGGYVMPPPHETEKSIRAVTPPTFSIGSGTWMGTRQRLQARRQHLKKKN